MTLLIILVMLAGFALSLAFLCAFLMNLWGQDTSWVSPFPPAVKLRGYGRSFPTEPNEFGLFKS
jgi:hypothetical protein